MHRCNECGKEGIARNHNGRGYRCPFCWSDNVVEVERKLEPQPEPVKKPAPRKRSPKATK